MRALLAPLLLALALLCGAAGCGDPAPARTAAGVEVPAEVAVVYMAAFTVLDELDKAETAIIKSWVEVPTSKQLVAAEARVQKLELAHAALGLLEQRLDKRDSVSRQDLAALVALLRDAASAFGADLPDSVGETLGTVEALLRGAP